MGRFEAMIPDFNDFIKEENGEWMLEPRIAKIIDVLGSRMAHSLRQAMFQSMGVDAKLGKGVDKAIGLDILNESGIGGLLDLVGMSETKKMLARNPKTMGMILQRVGPLLGQLSLGKNNSGGSSGSQLGAEWNKYG